MGNARRRISALAVALVGAVLFSGETQAGADPCSTELPNAARQFWIPLIGHGTDALGNQFDTVFKVINLQETPASFTVLTCSDTGETTSLLAGPGGEGPPVSTMQVSVAGRGTVTLNSLNSSPQTRLDTGWATISTLSAIGVEVIFNLRTDAGFLTSTNVRVGVLTQSTSFFADIGPSVNTGVPDRNRSGPRGDDGPIPGRTADAQRRIRGGVSQRRVGELQRNGGDPRRRTGVDSSPAAGGIGADDSIAVSAAGGSVSGGLWR